MPLSEWKETILGDVVYINPLRSIKKGSIAKKIPMDVLNTNDRSINNVESTEFTGSGTKFKNGDTLLARITPCLENGKTAYVDCLDENEIAFGSTEYIVMTGKDGITDNLFVYYLAREPQFRSYAIGHMEGSSGRQRVPASAVSKYSINLPLLPEQRAIANILGSLDDKIELNRQINKNLEDIAQSIFKSWFVDFDPVKAKAEGRTIEGLSQEILDLFPDTFEDSDLGEIPKGWEIKKLEELGNVICGKTPLTSKKEYYGHDIPFITIPDMHGKTFVTETNKTLSKLGADSQKNKYLPPFSISMSCIATPGLVILNPITAQTNQQINSIIPSDVNLSFYYFYLLKQISQTVISNGSGGSVFHNLNTSSFREIKTTINNKIGFEFNKIIKPIMTKILENQNETQTLSNLRDTLLPKLISGELRVPEAENFLEDNS